MVGPDILNVPSGYSKETSNKYDENIEKEKNKEINDETPVFHEELKNQKLVDFSGIIENAIYNPTLTESKYQFTDSESYEGTDISDKTDTYTNMNISYRYIRFNIDGAGELYNKLQEGNDFLNDSPKKVFKNIKNRLIDLGFNKKVNDQGELESFDPKDDKDMLYMVGFFQTVVEDKIENPSKKDFKIGPKTLSSLFEEDKIYFEDFKKDKSNISDKEDDLTNVENKEESKNEKKSEEESYIENNNEKIEEDDGYIDLSDLNGDENKEEGDESIIENDDKKEDVIEEVPNEETTEESSNIKVEKIGDRKFPRLRDVYKHGNEKYLFDKNDLSDRGLSDKIDYIPSMYKSLNLDRNLDNPIESEDLKEFLIKPWFKQLDKVIDDMEDGISIDGEKYKFTPEQIKEAIKNKGFIKTIKKDGKEYEIVFDTWTPEMKKISNSVRPLGDKEYQKTEGKSGSVKEKYQIEPVGLMYNKVNGIFNTDKKIGKISVGNRVLKQSN